MFLNLYLNLYLIVLNYLKLCKCVKHYFKLFKIVLIVIGVYINIYCSSILTFTNKTALGGDYFVTKFLPSLNRAYTNIHTYKAVLISGSVCTGQWRGNDFSTGWSKPTFSSWWSGGAVRPQWGPGQSPEGMQADFDNNLLKIN